MSQQAYDKLWRECISTLNEQLNVEGIDTAKEFSGQQVGVSSFPSFETSHWT